MNKKYLVLVVVLVLVAVGGYVLWQSTITVEERVGERAVERWHALMAGDFKKAYGFFGPGFRSATSHEAYENRLKKRAVIWEKIELRSVKCDKELCTVEVDVRYHPVIKGLEQSVGERVLTEKWVRTDDEWWYVE